MATRCWPPETDGCCGALSLSVPTVSSISSTFEGGFHPSAIFFFEAQAEGDVLKHVQVRGQRILLEHRIHRPFGRRHIGDVLAVQETFRFRGDKTGNHTQGRRLAAARRAEESDKLFVVNVSERPSEPFAHRNQQQCLSERRSRFSFIFIASPFAEFPVTGLLRAVFFLRSAQSP